MEPAAFFSRSIVNTNLGFPPVVMSPLVLQDATAATGFGAVLGLDDVKQLEKGAQPQSNTAAGMTVMVWVAVAAFCVWVYQK